ncbi:MAG TPA: HYR domain-containing protein [Pirellulaceae bacterium]|nr:HYR domain-containing protein [Pirellulaceae bacterium]
MSPRLRGLSIVSSLLLGSLFVAGVPARAQQGNLSYSQTDVSDARGYRMTDDGTVVGEARASEAYYEPVRLSPSISIDKLKHPDFGVFAVEGSARGVALNGRYVGFVVYKGAPRACYWQHSNAQATVIDPIVGSDTVASSANDIASTAGTIVGKTKKWGGVDRAFSWTSSAAGMVDLGSIDGGAGTSEALAVSGDGLVIVGESSAIVGGPARAFRWTLEGGMENLGTLDSAVGESCARDISTDGTVVVGESTSLSGRTRGFVYTVAGGMKELPTIGDHAGDCFAGSVSDDGRTIAGMSTSARYPQGEACVWIDGVAHSLERLLTEVYKIDMRGRTLLHACVSPNGLRFGGWGVSITRPTLYSARTYPDRQYPVVVSDDVVEGGVYTIRVGETFEATISGSDPDGGRAHFGSRGGPTGMTVTPPIGTSGPSPYSTVTRWTPSPTAFGQSYTFRFGFTDPEGGGGNLSFTVKVAPNVLPTVDPIGSHVLEYDGGARTVRLSTVVDDDEGQALKVVWRVNGVDQKTTTDVPPGSEVDFEFGYPRGTARVECRVSDARDTVTQVALVTVQDSITPVLVVSDVVVPTDAGQAFASNVVLPEPTASDASGEPVTVTRGDAPETYPVGATLVFWTATDAAGNVTKAAQKVTVEDQESPTIAGGEGIAVYVDAGRVFSTAKAPLPSAFDNVSESSAIRITSDAPPRFPIGTTTVTFRATDQAGNFAEWPTTVTVVNRPPIANAGQDVVIVTKSERGIRVSLDGRNSSDPDQQPLRFSWSAPGARLGGVNSALPAGLFPVGRTIATLTVTDSAGATRSDAVRIVVRLKNAKRRPRGSDANRSFAAASTEATRAVAAKRSSGAALSGLAYASAAAAYGDAAGDHVRWEEGKSEEAAALRYAELRAMQRTYGQAAASSLLAAYAETGDESLLSAYRYSVYGTAYAAADLSER